MESSYFALPWTYEETKFSDFSSIVWQACEQTTINSSILFVRSPRSSKSKLSTSSPVSSQTIGLKAFLSVTRTGVAMPSEAEAKDKTPSYDSSPQMRNSIFVKPKMASTVRSTPLQIDPGPAKERKLSTDRHPSRAAVPALESPSIRRTREVCQLIYRPCAKPLHPHHYEDSHHITSSGKPENTIFGGTDVRCLLLKRWTMLRAAARNK